MRIPIKLSHRLFLTHSDAVADVYLRATVIKSLPDLRRTNDLLYVARRGW